MPRFREIVDAVQPIGTTPERRDRAEWRAVEAYAAEMIDLKRFGRYKAGGMVATLHWRLFGVYSPSVIHGAQRGRAAMAVCFKGAHVPTDIILTCVRWSVASPLSTRHVEELLQERGVSVDHSTVNRWVVRYSPQLEAAFHRRKRLVRRSLGTRRSV